MNTLLREIPIVSKLEIAYARYRVGKSGRSTANCIWYNGILWDAVDELKAITKEISEIVEKEEKQAYDECVELFGEPNAKN